MGSPALPGCAIGEKSETSEVVFLTSIVSDFCPIAHAAEGAQLRAFMAFMVNRDSR